MHDFLFQMLFSIKKRKRNIPTKIAIFISNRERKNGNFHQFLFKAQFIDTKKNIRVFEWYQFLREIQKNVADINKYLNRSNTL